MTALAAQVRVPLPGTTVPMTLQTLAVLLTGFALPPGAAMASMVVYLVSGMAGLPVFAGGVGTVAIGGVTWGYLVGFVPAAGLVSLVRARGTSSVRLSAAGALGTVVVLASGVAWQVGLSGSWEATVARGVVPFLPDAVVKLALAVVLAKACAGAARRTAAAAVES